MIRLSKSQVLLIHGQLTAETGGSSGLRDEGMLDSALNAPFKKPILYTDLINCSTKNKAAPIAGVYCPWVPTRICSLLNLNGAAELICSRRYAMSSSVKYGARYPLIMIGASMTIFRFFMVNAR